MLSLGLEASWPGFLASTKCTEMSKPTEPLHIFGVDFSYLTETQQLLLLAFGHLFCALGFAALQEKVFIIEGKIWLETELADINLGFHYGGFMTFITTATYALCARIERVLLNDREVKAKYR